MKMVFVEFVECGGDIIDVGALVCDPDDHYVVLGYMGVFPMVPGGDESIPEEQFDKMKELWPKVMHGRTLIPPVRWADVDAQVAGFVSRYLDEDDEPYMLVHRTKCEDLAALLPGVTHGAHRLFNLHFTEPTFDVFGIESHYSHDAEKYDTEVRERAVHRCVHNHAEFIVYRNNILGWAEEETARLRLMEQPADT